METERLLIPCGLLELKAEESKTCRKFFCHRDRLQR